MVDFNPIHLASELLKIGGNSTATQSTSPTLNAEVQANKTPSSTTKPAAPANDTSTSTSSDAGAAAPTTAAAPSTTDSISGAQSQLEQLLQPINPMAMQLFAHQIIMPWMKQLAGMTQHANQAYGAAEKSFAQLPGMSSYAPGLQQLSQVPNRQLDASNLTSAFLGAAGSAPAAQAQQTAMQQVQSLLGQLVPQEQRLAAYYDPSYQILAGQAAGGLGGVGGIGAPGQLPAPPSG